MLDPIIVESENDAASSLSERTTRLDYILIGCVSRPLKTPDSSATNYWRPLVTSDLDFSRGIYSGKDALFIL